MTALPPSQLPVLQKRRTVTEIIRDSFQYLSSEARFLIGPLALYSFSIVAIAIFISYYTTGGMPDLLRIFMTIKSSEKGHGIFMLLGLITYLGSICTLTFIINKNLIYNNSEQKETHDAGFKAGDNFFSDFGNYAVSFIIVYVIYYCISIGLEFLGNSDLFLNDQDEEFDQVNYYLESFLMSLPKLLIYPILFYFCFVTLFVALRDNLGATDAIKKVMDISKNKMKKTWLTGVMVLIICYIGFTIVNFPIRYVYFIFPANFTAAMIGLGVSKLISFTLYIYINAATVFIFGSIEDENEGHYVKNKIKMIDNETKSPAS